MRLHTLWSKLFLVLNFCSFVKSTNPPHIIVIVADDLGFDDVSFHGSDQIPTPNIDKLANEGIILNNHYVQPLCTPSRSAIMTGRYPIHTGMYEFVISATEPWGLGLDEKLLPQYLKELGYATHAVGKWHLGFFEKDYTPTYRGFDTFYGYYCGKGDYWDHSNDDTFWGLDLHNNKGDEIQPVYTQWGNYSTNMFTLEAIDRINNNTDNQPLFLYLAYQAVHSANRHDPLQAPTQWIDKYSYIKHEGRRKFAATLGYMDYSIGKVYEALEKNGMLDNTVILFTSDNGGPANGFLNPNWASNFPLRGIKMEAYEGGVRAASFVNSKLLKNPGTTSMELMHITDWLPTFVNLAGGNVTGNETLDGVDLWDTLQNGSPSPREEILVNINQKQEALIVGDWKIIKEDLFYDGWYSPPGYNATGRTTSVVKCGEKPQNSTLCNEDFGHCLFNLKKDPCEYDDVSKKYPDVFNELMLKLNKYRKTMVPSREIKKSDPRSNPKLHNGDWIPWV